MWTPFRTKLEETRKEFKIPSGEFKAVGMSNWQEIKRNIEDNFVETNHPKSGNYWYWEYFKQPTTSISFDKDPYILLNQLIDEKESVWFFINESSKLWFYEGKIGPIQKIIGEVAGIDEYYLASKKYRWLLCLNHHNFLIATGKEIPNRLKSLE